ncbi:MAG: cyclic nucleotide-binding domain-containing protein [Rhodospirillales bacterium]|nr:cyclic nucleotide-binding domain-containing protein [Rhodospirillales bacterium]
MKTRQKKFREGDVVFREGDPSREAYIIETGQIDLVKEGARGTVRLATLVAGDILGEMGILDDSPRSATATAVGKVTLKIIARDDFMKALRDEPGLAASIMEKMAARLRNADAMLAERGVGALAAPETQPSMQARAGGDGFFSRLFQKRPAGRTASIEILVAGLVGDEDGMQAKRLVAAFEGAQGVRARMIGQPLQPSKEGGMADQLSALIGTGRKWLSDKGGDLLIWGTLDEEKKTMRLRFLSALDDIEDRPGATVATSATAFPAEFGEEFSPLLIAVALSALTPSNEAHLQMLRLGLPQLLPGARIMGQKPPLDLERNDQASIQVAYGNATATAGHFTGDGRWFEEARAAYEQAIKSLARTNARLDWAMAHKQLGATLMALGERDEKKELYEQATEALRNAMTVMTRADLPGLWALTQARLGTCLYRLDSLDGESQGLKDSCIAFQNALQVLSMTGGAAAKWSETKHSLAQALQVLGGQERRPELIEHAIEACNDALKVRDREQMPAAWASTQNNLGSALFLLGKLTSEREPLEKALEAFEGAIETYQAIGATRMAAVTERNLARVREVLGPSPKERTYLSEE